MRGRHYSDRRNDHLLAEPITAPRHKVIVGQQVNERTIKELSTELQQTGPLAFRRSSGSLWTAAGRSS